METPSATAEKELFSKWNRATLSNCLVQQRKTAHRIENIVAFREVEYMYMSCNFIKTVRISSVGTRPSAWGKVEVATSFSQL